MSYEIDERIVEMRFDNRQFEDGVKTSLNTLDTLKKNLNFSDIAQSASSNLGSIANAVDKVDMTAFGKSVEAAGKKFSVLDTIAVGSLLKIGGQVASVGEKLIKSFTVDNISAGWKKFVDKTNSVATLLAQGYDMSTVEEQLKRLNWFTDETSFEFTEMVSSIAKFTAAGQGLESSVTALEGIATWAALSGQNAATASRAMYQLSQAMGAGVMRKEDYKSIQNVSMDTTEFRTKALEAGVALGTLKKNADGTFKSLMGGKDAFTINQFADHLTKDAWFTSDVMMKVYNEYSAAVDQIYNYADRHNVTASEAIKALGNDVDEFGLKAFKAAQEARSWQDVVSSVQDAVSTGWMNTFEIIFGNYEQQRVLWTDLANSLYDVFAEPMNIFNDWLWDAFSSGWDKFLAALNTTGVKAADFKEKLREIAEGKGILLDDVISEYGSLEAAIQGGAISSDILREAAIASVSALKDIDEVQLGDIRTFNSQLEELLEHIDELGGRQHLIGAFWDMWEVAGLVLGTVKDAFTEIFPGVSAEALANMLKGLHEATSRLKSFLTETEKGKQLLENLKNAFKGFFSLFDIAGQGISAFFRAIAPAMSKIFPIFQKFQSAKYYGILQILGQIGTAISGFAEKLRETDAIFLNIKKVVDAIGAGISKMGDVLTSGFKSYMGLKNIKLPDLNFKMPWAKKAQDDINGVNDAIEKAAYSVDLLNANSEKMIPVVERAKSGTTTLVKATNDEIARRKDDLSEFIGKIKDFVKTFYGKAKPILTAIFGEDFTFDSIKGVFNLIITGSLTSGILKLIDGFKNVTEKVEETVASIKNIPEAVRSFINRFAKIGDSAAGVLDQVRDSIKSYQKEINANTLIKIAVAMTILAGALYILGSIDPTNMIFALGAMTVLFAELLGAMKLFSKISDTGIAKGQTSKLVIMMTALSLTMLMLSSAVKKLASVDILHLGAAVGALGLIMFEMQRFIATVKIDENMKVMRSAAAFVVLVTGIRILASAVVSLGQLGLTDVAASLGALGGTLFIIVKFINSMNKTFGGEDKKKGGPGKLITIGLALIAFGAAMKLFASSMAIIGQLNWDQVLKGLISIGAILAMVSSFAHRTQDIKRVLRMGPIMLLVATSLRIFGLALYQIGSMNIDTIQKALYTLGIALMELGMAASVIDKKVKGFRTLIVAAATIFTISRAFKAFEKVEWAAIYKGLTTLAASLTIIGVAAIALQGIKVPMFAIMGIFAAFGAASFLLGKGLVKISEGLISLSVGIGAMANTIISRADDIKKSMITLAEASGEATVAYWVGIAKGGEAFGNAIKTVVHSFLDILPYVVSDIAKTLLLSVLETLDMLVQYIPQIVDKIVDVIVQTLDALKPRIPELVKSITEFVDVLIETLESTFGPLNPEQFMKHIAVIGMLIGLVPAFAAIKNLIPSAMVGALGVMGIVVEIGAIAAAVALALGALYEQFPKMKEFIDKGGDIFESVGVVIGKFIGGIIGGVASGATSTLGEIATHLSDFMTNLTPFLEQAALIKEDSFTGVKNLIGSLILLRGSDIFETFGKWITGNDSFGAIDGLSEDFSQFGTALAAFSESISEISDEDIDRIGIAAEAGKALAEMGNKIPPSGINQMTQVVGERDLSAFGEQLVVFGFAMVKFAKVVANLTDDDVSKINTAAAVGERLAEMGNQIPHSGISLLTAILGDKSMSDFGQHLVIFGRGIVAFSQTISGLTTEDVVQIFIAAKAGEALAAMAESIPNTGGLKMIFAGENDLFSFGIQLVAFGHLLVGFSESISDLTTEDIDHILLAAKAGTALGIMAKLTPDLGGLKQRISGDKNLYAFGYDIKKFGGYLKEFSASVSEISDQDIDKIHRAAKVGMAIALVARVMPEANGAKQWFTGSRSLKTLGGWLGTFGEGIKSFATSMDGVVIDESTIGSALIAVKAISKMQGIMSEENNIFDMLANGVDFTILENTLPGFGSAIKSYGDNVNGINSDAIIESARAVPSLAKILKSINTVSGLFDIFTDAILNDSVKNFGEDMLELGTYLAGYSAAIADVNVGKVTASAISLNVLADALNKLDIDTGDPIENALGSVGSLQTLGNDIQGFGSSLAIFNTSLAGIDTAKFDAVATSIGNLVNIATTFDSGDETNTSIINLGAMFKDLGDTSINNLVETFDGADAKLLGAINGLFTRVSESISGDDGTIALAMQTALSVFWSGVNDKTGDTNNLVSSIMAGMAAKIIESTGKMRAAATSVFQNVLFTIKGFIADFTAVGMYIAQGLVSGMLSKKYAVSIAGRTLGEAALIAAKRALDSQSPSKEFIHLGENIGEGMAIGIHNNIMPAAEAAAEMSNEVIAASKKGLDKFKDWLSEKKYYGEISSVEELAGWEQLQKQYKAGSKERKEIDREVYRVQNEIVEATYQHSIDWIEKEKEMYGRSTEWEIAQYEKIQYRYLWGSKERMEIDKKLYGLHKQLADEAYENSMNWIEEQEFYGLETLASRLAAFKRVKNNEEYTEKQRKDAAKEEYKITKEIYETRKKYIEDVEQVQTEAFEKQKQLEEDHKKQVEEINAKLAEDIKKLEDDYTQALENRAKSLYDAYGLFDKVKEREEISGTELLDNLQGQVDEFNEWQNILDDLSARGVDSALIAELQEMGPEAISKIKALSSLTDNELDRYVDLWKVKHAQARGQAVEELKGLRKDTDDQIAQLRIDAQTQIDEADKAYLKSLDDLNKETNKKLDELRKEFGEKVGLIKKDTEKEMKEMTEVAKEILLAAGWDESGQAIVDGIIDGVRKEAPKLLEEIEQLGLEGAKSKWEGESYETVKRSSTSADSSVTQTSKQPIMSYKDIKSNYTTVGQKLYDIEGVKNQVISYLQVWKNASLSAKKSAEYTAKQSVKGFIEEIQNPQYKSVAINAVADFLGITVNAARKELGINSPSRVFMEIGGYTVLGFVEGLIDYADKSYDAASYVAEEAKFGLSDAMLGITDYLNGDLEICPTIRPVLDISDVANGVNTVNDYFHNSNLMALAGRTSFEFRANSKDSMINVNVNNDNVIQELRSLRADAADMINRMENLKIVLDSGKLVGETVGKMDVALGRRQSYRGRGI